MAETDSDSVDSQISGTGMGAYVDKGRKKEMDQSNTSDVEQYDNRGMTLLHKAACKKNTDMIANLLKSGANMHVRTRNEGASALHVAAANGSTDVIEFLLNTGEDIDVLDKMKHTPVHYAAKHGEFEALQLLINKNADIDVLCVHSNKAVHYAIEYGFKEGVELLLSDGLEGEDSCNGSTLLYWAVKYGQLEIVKYLEQANADIHAFVFGKHLIHTAAECGDKNVVEYFLSKGVSIDIRSYRGWTPLHFAAQGNQVRVIKSLLEKGADPNDENYHKADKPLHIATYCSSFEAVRTFLDFGVDINSCEYYGNTPLHEAARKGDVKLTKYLIEKGANISAKNFYGENPMHIAARLGYKELVKIFLDEGIDVDETGSDGWTALHSAIKNLHLNLTKYLIERGASIKASANCRTSALCVAAMYRPSSCGFDISDAEDEFEELEDKYNRINEKILDLLIKMDGGINDPADEDCWVPLHYALHDAAGKGVSYIVDKLINAGAKCDIQDCNGLTPLYLAVKEDNDEALQLMVITNPNLDIQYKGGKTLLHFACENHNTKIMKILLYAGANPDIKNRRGMSVLFYYIRDHVYIPSMSEEVQYFIPPLEILEKINDYINIDDRGRRTAVHLAIDKDSARDFLELLVLKQKNLNIEDALGNTPLNYLTEEWAVSKGYECAELIKLLISNGAYLKTVDCERIIENPFLRRNLCRDVQFCSLSIANKFNEMLPALYRLPLNIQLPSVERLKLQNNKMQRIEHVVEIEIKHKGYCDVSKTMPMPLAVLALNSYVAHYSRDYQ